MPDRRARHRFRDLIEQAVASDSLRADAEALLWPLTAYDHEHNGDLLRTLGVYLATGCNASRAAETLFLHRNGLLYRLNRIEQLLDVSLGDTEVTLGLDLALRALSADDSGQRASGTRAI